MIYHLIKRFVLSLTALISSYIFLAISTYANVPPENSKAPSQIERHQQANKAFGLSRSEFVRLNIEKGPAKPFDVEINLNGMSSTIELTPVSIRSPNFKLLIQQPDGSLEPTEPGPISTYRGIIKETPGSKVAASLTDEGLKARIIYPDGNEVWLTPLGKQIPGSQKGDHIAFRLADSTEEPGTCGAKGHSSTSIDFSAAHSDNTNLSESTSVSPTTSTASATQVTEIAIDADYEYFQTFGSIEATTNRIQEIINSANIQYERDVQITHTISQIIIRSSANDPYTSTNASDVLYEFRNHWNQNHTNIQRDISHLFTGKNLDGGTIGIAWLGVICNGNYGYGVSQHLSNFGAATILTAHELGHNWDAYHCDCVEYTMNPFISSSATTRFEPNTSIPSISNFRDSRSCLDDTTSEPPAAPNALTAVATSHTEIALNWNDNANNESSYEIARSRDGVTWAILTTLGAETNTYKDTQLNPLTTYFYKVRANNNLGASDYSNEAQATTEDIPPPPEAPTNLTASINENNTNITLEWQDNAFNETGFEIERSNNSIDWRLIRDLNSVNETGYTDDSELQPNKTYFYRVRTVNSTGESAYSNVASATTPNVILLAPLQTKRSKGSKSVILTWQGGIGSTVRILRNGSNIESSAPNTGSYTDSLGKTRGAKSFTYQICERDGSKCSNTRTASF